MHTAHTLALSETDALSHREASGKTAPALARTPVFARTNTERKVVTILFLDVRNSTKLSREIDLENWWSVSAGLYELICDSADQFGGWVGDFTGDGANAVFESPGDADHHARRACLAALWLRDAVLTLAAEIRSVYRREISVRIGINSGEVLTGTMGHRHRGFFTVNGYPVAIAKRVEALARPNGIYLTGYTAAFVANGFQLHDLGLVEVKGADAPVRIFELGGRVTPTVTRA
jgi:class 3 adenylate cyclase